jgi:predicted Zn-dependent protease
VQSSKIQNDEKPIDTNLSIIEQPSLPTQIQNSTKYTHEQNKTEDALFLQLPLIGKNNLEKKGASLPEIPETKTNINIQEEELDNRVLVRKTTQTSEKQIDPLLLPPPLLDEDKPKGFIKIETQEVNSIKYLKERFDKSHNIIFALMLADEYYIAKNYQESNKWAIIANTIDADNEKSWILFAKSKVKLGKKEDAISALEAYLKNNKANKVVQSVLNRILSGENID